MVKTNKWQADYNYYCYCLCLADVVRRSFIAAMEQKHIIVVVVVVVCSTVNTQFNTNSNRLSWCVACSTILAAERQRGVSTHTQIYCFLAATTS